MKQFIKDFFLDDSHRSSATRLAFLTWSIGVFVIWAGLCVFTHTLVPIPQSVVELTMVFVAGKVGGAYVDYNSNQNTLPVLSPPVHSIPLQGQITCEVPIQNQIPH